ncbi:uncharacterized protein V1518DRAFT_96412 [Limtongia smithiae]|uniref:uncharacterized protein n=1 Tax=Limtongia smithiae TaxID=1125753 RepID=UPI0034CF52E6
MAPLVISHVPCRISLLSELGTLRYHGPIPAWPDISALGIEWDDASRGKHSGDYNGRRYFDVVVPNSGTFLKASNRKFDEPRDFVTVLRERYAPKAIDEMEKEDISFGLKVAERVGFDKIREILSHLDQLTLVTLDKQCIASVSDFSDLRSICPNIQSLDISNNLFETLSDIAKITSQLPQLGYLRLNGNRILSWDLPDDYSAAFGSVEVVSLANMFMPLEFISNLPTLFPKVRECSLAGNNISADEILFDTDWPLLESLDLSYNKLTRVPLLIFGDVASSACITPLKNLNLSHNQVSNIVSLEPWQTSTSPRITAIDLRHNSLSTWRDVDILSADFPDVMSIWLKWNPLYDGIEEDDAHLQTVARWGGLTSLNGIRISEKERSNAEIYFMNRIARGEVKDFDITSMRYKTLIDAYGKSYDTSQSAPKRGMNRITFIRDDTAVKKAITRNMTVQKLKLLASRWCKIPVLHMDLVLMDPDGQEFILDDSVREVEYYGVDDGSTIAVRSKG